MTKDGWKHAVIEAVSAAAFGNTERIERLSLILEASEKASATLASRGYKGNTWPELVASVLERDRERELDGKPGHPEGVTATAHLRTPPPPAPPDPSHDFGRKRGDRATGTGGVS